MMVCRGGGAIRVGRVNRRAVIVRVGSGQPGGVARNRAGQSMMNRWLHTATAQSRSSATANPAVPGHEARVVAIHEAGHAVGRILTARRLGWREDEAIARIEVYAMPTTVGKPQAAMYGPLLSRPMDEY